VAVREGDEVRRGQVLFELDALDQQSLVATARARAAAATARAAAAAAAADEVEQQWRRNRELVAQGAVAKSTGDDLEARLRAMRAAAEAANVEAGAVAADVRARSETLRHFRVLAPIDGRVVGKPAEIGEVVRPDAQGPLLQLVDFASLLVEVDVPEARLGLVKAGAPVEIVLDAYPDRRLRGEVAEITPRVNRAKATVAVKAKFRDRAEGVLPEMAARVGFLSKPLDEAALAQAPKQVVPGAAVVDRRGGKVVFVVEDGRVREAAVTLGPPLGDGFELRSGPAPGARLVRNPPATMAEGHAVKEKAAGR
ncbi:MAG TPA: efflux RND transporter periplasmic adaptor subunit, partial [Polyangiaceae bacterium]|nr:efflux RND transporter periplasmic adaptor subunit [Polyangiaceae bacterium]